MKKILLTMGLFSLVLIGRSQTTVLNEIYTDPNLNGGHSEFFELYNTSIGGSQNVDCYTVVTYYEEGTGSSTKSGFYVMDLPDLSVAGKGWFVGAAHSPFNTQNPLFQNVIPNFSWNAPSFRSGSTGGSLTKWEFDGATSYIQKSIAADSVEDFLSAGTGTSGTVYAVFVFVNGAFNNGFLGGMSSGAVPPTISALPDLPVTMNTTFHPCGNFIIHFNTLPIMEFKGSTPGTDNGYARTSDGKCGAWEKTASGVNHTPGVTNGSAAGLTGSLTTAQSITCNTAPHVSVVNFNITGFSGDVSLAADFPVDVQLYYDFGTIGTLDGADVFQRSKSKANINLPDTFIISQTQPVILAYRTQRGCFDKVVSLVNGCLPLPVSFKSFTAARNHSVVSLRWETSWEANSSGFAIERNIRGTWEQIAFVPSQAAGGNSNSLLGYQYNDLNNVNGISQYRLRQVDFDARSKYSDIRAVRGEGQAGHTIVFPNPSLDGRVSIVFEDATVTRDAQLSDMSGRVLKQWKGVTNNNIQLENLTPGMYSLRIVVPETGEQSVQKIIVSKR
jgi:Secretion system C-terminal sorting domain